MGLETLVQLLGLLVVSFALAAGALWVLARMGHFGTKNEALHKPQADDEIVFLFEGDILVNATSAGEKFLLAEPAAITDWVRFLSAAEAKFPDLDTRIAALEGRGNISLRSSDAGSSLVARYGNGLLRVRLDLAETSDAGVGIDHQKYNAMVNELETLRATAESAPFLVWRQNSGGAIIWANNAYLALSQAAQGNADAPTWPPARLFDLTTTRPPMNLAASVRHSTHIAGEAEPRWFECFQAAIGDEILYTAVAADKVVRAEITLRDFVQTLTKTFAHLTVGLAIFDKQRRLTLFNPALSDLTSLSAEFLSGRPTFQSVLDKLREKQMIPEPKDYKSWRRRLFELEEAAANGTYEETWSLANGLTYRITGRPHPDGAVAFLFEDISAEISLTRRFRAELKIGQSVLDSLGEGLAVFSQSGSLMISNAAYSQLWGQELSTILGNISILDATRAWTEKCLPSPVWGDAREFVGTVGERAEWSANVQLHDGRNLICRFRPLPGGGTLAGFTIADAQPATIGHNGVSSIKRDSEIVSA